MRFVRLPVLWLLVAVSIGIVDSGTAAAQLGIERADSSVGNSHRWALRSLSPVRVGSTIVRLEDVVQPIDSHHPMWSRLRRCTIGLVPVNGQPMVIDRDRLADVIRSTQATPPSIDWIGPKTIRVEFDRDAVARRAPSNSAGSGVRQVSASVPISSSHKTAPLPFAAAQEIDRLIRMSIDRQYRNLKDDFEIEIDLTQIELTGLAELKLLPTVRFLDPLEAGSLRLEVIENGRENAPRAIIKVDLHAHPLVVFPRKSLMRGHRLRIEDLVAKPFPRASSDGSLVADPKSIVGLEVAASLPSNRPISRVDVRSPILVSRGDLVDIRVIDGGVIVTTRAKAMSDASEGESVEVETMIPRKRLLARVVQSGLVEIITRPQQVSGGR